MDFTGKVVVITGAAIGIGAGTARYLAKLGAQISLVDINSQGLIEVAEQLKADNSPTPLVLVADVRTDSTRIIDETISHFERIDVLVNNAGVGGHCTIFDTDISVYDEMMNTNLRSIVMLTKLAIPHLQKTKGNIINMSSIAGMVPVKYAYYAMAKAALDHFTKCLAVELGHKNIRINSVNPAYVSTPMFYNTFSTEEMTRFLNACKIMYPLARVAEVEEVAAAVAFLASDKASFITGIQLPVDGGAIPAGAFNLRY